MNAKIPGFVIYVETIIYLLLHNLYDCTFKFYRNCCPIRQRLVSEPEVN